MKLQTPISILAQQPKIDYGSKILFLGSCFSENIGLQFDRFRFQNLQNPLGILFHPFGIEKLLFRATQNDLFTAQDVFCYNETWHCFEAHSRLKSTQSQDDLLLKLNSAIRDTQEYLQNSTHIVITLGTAYIYRHLENDQYVANCHKVPQKCFAKSCVKSEAILTSLKRIMNYCNAIRKDVKVIFTVSPVRHMKDGLVENNYSKAQLITAIHDLLPTWPQASYFPSYEIMLDELRDYRFYSKDMLHPSSLAIEYIWERFMQTWINPNAFETMKKVDSVQKRLEHKAFNPQSKQHQNFLQKLNQDMEALQNKYGFMRFTD